jgi:hypothetical protein
MPKQGGDGVRNVEPVRAKPEPGGGAGARDVGGAQGCDRADLLAVEQDEAAGDAVAGRDGLVEQQPSDRRESRLGRRPGGFRLGVDHRQVDAAEDVLAAGPGQEGEGMLPGAGPAGEPSVEVVLGALAEPASAAGSEVKNAIATMRRYLARAVAGRRGGSTARPQVA